MNEIVLTTYDWVPEMPRGFVRDIRLRWALEEAGLPYRVESTPFDHRGPEHLTHQPFAQVPWLTDGDLSVFESGAMLLHLGERSDILLPTDPKARNEAKEWLFAAFASVEAATQHWTLLTMMGRNQPGPAWEFIDQFTTLRLQRMEVVLAGRDWLAGDFSIADIMMADVLRIVDRLEGLNDYPACRAYVARATARPAFRKALADQMAHFAAADAARA